MTAIQKSRADIGSGDILIVRNDRLGDTILALPVISTLKKQLNELSVHFWAAQSVAPIIRHVQGIDSVIEGDDKGRGNALEQIEQLNIQTAFCLRPTLSNARTLKKAGIPVRIGTGRRLYSVLFTHRMNISRKHSNRHEADLNLDMLAEFGIDSMSRFPEIHIPSEASMAVEGLLKQHNVDTDKRLVVIHPGSGGSARDWHQKYFSELADRLASFDNVNIAITGSEAEMQICNQVSHNRHINLCGRTDLINLSALLKKAELIISNSTGPLHLAVALGRRVLGLYPPVNGCLPERWGPYGRKNSALMPNLPLCDKCRPGIFSDCYCMEQLSPDTVYEHAIKALDTNV